MARLIIELDGSSDVLEATLAIFKARLPINLKIVHECSHQNPRTPSIVADWRAGTLEVNNLVQRTRKGG